MLIKNKHLLAIILLTFLATPFAVLAVDLNSSIPQTFQLNVPIGELKEYSISNTNNDLLGRYIQAWYGFLLGTIGIMATVMIMWGGFKYLTSRGDSGIVGDAKKNIISAITGVALAFGAYTILSLINPALLTITMPSLPGIKGGENVNLEIGTDEESVNSLPTRDATNNAGNNNTAVGHGGGPYGFGNGLPGLPAPGGPNILPTTRQIEADISEITNTNPTNDFRPNSTGSNHQNGSAVDFPNTNDNINNYFDSLVQGSTPYNDPKWGPIYTLTNVQIGNTTYPTIRIIDEANCWHVDQGKR